MADTSTNAQMKTYLEEITHTANDSNFAASTYEQQLLNKAYMKAAYMFNWPQTLKRWFDASIAYVDRYSLQSDFRKFMFMRGQGTELDVTDIDNITNGMNEYATALDSLEYILANQPTTATTAFTFAGSYSAGSAVVITLASVSGLSAGDEIFISDTTTSEFTKVQSVDTSAVTITVKLANAHSNKTLYRTTDGNYFQYQKQITLLSGASDVPILPGETHLVIPHWSAALYYRDIEEPDRAQVHEDIFTKDLTDAWLAWGKTESGEAGEFTI